MGLGRIHGVSEGDTLAILNTKGKKVGDMVAEKVGNESCHATLERGTDIRPGYLVFRENPAEETAPREA